MNIAVMVNHIYKLGLVGRWCCKWSL